MDILPEELLTRVLSWTPLTSHGSLRLTCKKFRSIINSDEFRKARPRVLVAYISGEYEPVTEHVGDEVWALLDGQWREVPWRVDIYEQEGAIEGATVVTVNSTKDGFLFTGNRRRNVSHVMQVFDGERSNLPTGLERRASPAVCHFGKCTILAGGWDNEGRCLSSVEMFDPQIEIWTEFSPMPHTVYIPVSGVVGQKLYVVGGGCGFKGVQIYDIASNSWDVGPPLPEEFYANSAAVVDGIFYVLEKTTSDCSLKKLKCFAFNEGRQEWIETPPLEPEADFCLLEHNGQLLAIDFDYPKVLQLKNDWGWHSWESVPELAKETKLKAFMKIRGVASVVLG